jgi:hypothetical protein
VQRLQRSRFQEGTLHVKPSFSLNSKMESNPTNFFIFIFDHNDHPFILRTLKSTAQKQGGQLVGLSFDPWSSTFLLLLLLGRLFFNLVCTKCLIVSITPKEDFTNKQFII